MARQNTSLSLVKSELAAHEGDEQVAAAIVAMNSTRDLDVARYSIGLLSQPDSPIAREALLEKYAWCQAQPVRRDGGAFIRSAILCSLRPFANPADIPLLLQATCTYEIDGALETGGDLRAAALLSLNDIDPDLAAHMAARLMLDPQVTLSDEPAASAIRLLASHGNLPPIFGLVSWAQVRSENIAMGLQNLIDLPGDLIPMLIERYEDTEDTQIALGLFDLLLGRDDRDRWSPDIERWFRTTTLMDIYGVVALQIIGSRSEVLITMLRDLRSVEIDPLHQQLLDQALALT